MKLDRNCFIVRDANGQALAYVYFEEERVSTVRRNHVRSWGRSGLLAKMAQPTLM